MKFTGLLILTIGMTFNSCSQNSKTTPTIENKPEKKDIFDASIARNEISELIRQLYKWADKNNITIGQTAITDENEEKVIGLDTKKNLEFIDQFRKTNLFSEEFLSNYQKIVKTLDKKFKTKEIEWLAGDMPPFGNGNNPWCNCQDEPYIDYWNKIEITFIELNQSEATLTWTWGQSDWSNNFKYKVKVRKENEKWKISYLQGFDFDEITKRNY